MSWLDIAIIAIIGIVALVGFKIGIIKAVLTLVGVIVGIVLAGRFYVALADRLTFIPQETLARVVAFAIILIGVMLVASIIAGVLKWLTSIVLLGWVNRLGGALLGCPAGYLDQIPGHIRPDCGISPGYLSAGRLPCGADAAARGI